MQKQLDWLAFSKLPPNSAENMLQLSHLLQGSIVSAEMFDRLPKSYLNRFFTTVRNELVNYSLNQPRLEEIIEIKRKQRQEVVAVMSGLESRVKKSKLELEEQKRGVDQLGKGLERMSKKLAKVKSERRSQEKERERERVKEKEKGKTREQSFYCPYCKIDGFSNKDNFENHMLTQHPLKGDDSANTMKEVVLALKEKEIALMEMVLKRNEDVIDMNRKLAEKQWSSRTRQFQTAQNFASPSVESIESEKQPQLASLTSYVWFQKQNNSRRANENPLNQYQTNRSQYQKGQNFISDTKSYERNPQKPGQQRKDKVRFLEDEYTPYEVQIVSSYKPPTLKEELDFGVRLGLYTTQKEPLKSYKVVPEECENSLYHTKNLSKITSGYHVYCSGPLEDDESDSEVSDYFNVKPRHKVIDEQIQIPSHLLQKYNIPTLEPNQKSKDESISHSNYREGRGNSLNRTHTIKTLASPLSVEKGERSGMASLLFSVEDKDFSLSKDSNSINLSDLKYEDLLIKKQSERRSEESPGIQEFIKQKSTGFQKKMAHQLLLSEFYESETVELSHQFPLRKVSTYKSNGGTLLDEFITHSRSKDRKDEGRRRSEDGSPKNVGQRTETSKERQCPPRQKIERVDKTSSLMGSIPSIPKHTQHQLPHNQMQSNFPRIQESQVNYKEPTSRQDSESRTQRLILQTLIDLTLIREEQLEHSIDHKQ